MNFYFENGRIVKLKWFGVDYWGNQVAYAHVLIAFEDVHTL